MKSKSIFAQELFQLPLHRVVYTAWHGKKVYRRQVKHIATQCSETGALVNILIAMSPTVTNLKITSVTTIPGKVLFSEEELKYILRASK